MYVCLLTLVNSDISTIVIIVLYVVLILLLLRDTFYKELVNPKRLLSISQFKNLNKVHKKNFAGRVRNQAMSRHTL